MAAIWSRSQYVKPFRADFTSGKIRWGRSRNCGCLVTCFCYQLIAKPGNKTATVPWPEPDAFIFFSFLNASMTGSRNPSCDAVFFFPNNQYHGCRWPDEISRRDASSHSIDLTLPEYSGSNAKRVNPLKPHYLSKHIPIATSAQHCFKQYIIARFMTNPYLIRCLIISTLNVILFL